MNKFAEVKLYIYKKKNTVMLLSITATDHCIGMFFTLSKKE